MSDVEWKPCHNCGAYVAPPRLTRRTSPRRDIPPGFRVAFNLCYVCIEELQARRSDLWGWIYRWPAKKRKTKKRRETLRKKAPRAIESQAPADGDGDGDGDASLNRGGTATGDGVSSDAAAAGPKRRGRPGDRRPVVVVKVAEVAGSIVRLGSRRRRSPGQPGQEGE
jgi:hypothetical protein